MAVGETVFFKNFGPRVGEMVLVSLGRSHLCRGRKRPGEEAMVHTLRTLPALVLRPRGRLCPFLLSLSLGRGGVGQRRAGRGGAEKGGAGQGRAEQRGLPVLGLRLGSLTGA